MANEYAVNHADLVAVADAIRAKGETAATLAFPSGFVSAVQAISSGVELNFNVVGGASQPANPAENTIWVKTEVEITSWSFGPDAPTNVSSGMVWFFVGETSAIEFNALKENAIAIRLTSAHQYINGAWVDKEALVYQNGQWADLVQRYYLFKSGEGAKVSLLTYNDRDGTAFVTVGTNSINITANSSAGGFRTALRSSSKIDLSKYSALKMKCTPTAVYTNSFTQAFENSFGVTATAFTSSEPSSISWSSRVKITGASAERTITVDISSITTSLYVALHFCGRMTVSDIWLE